MHIDSLRGEVRRLLLAHGYARIYEHSVLVTREAARLAERFGEDLAAAEAAALLHDIGAAVPEAERAGFLASRQIAVLEEEARLPLILHQKVSRVLAGEMFGVQDAAVLDAVGCHTTLRPDASRLDMVLFVADKLAWDQPGTPPYREAVLKGLDASLEAGAYAYIGYLLDNRAALKVVHPWMEAAWWARAEARPYIE